VFATMNWSDLLSACRLVEDDSPEKGRSPFQRDHDRIIFSDAFRRLQGKTQVHPLPDNDHIHNRLTHTLEVASVGRSLGEGVGLYLSETNKLPNEIAATDVGAIVQAACLAHDLGNPPFGHAGEFAIRDWFQRHGRELNIGDDTLRDLSSFEGNAQGFRIATDLALNASRGGLRLTVATLSAFHKYPWSSRNAERQGKDKFGYFETESKIFEQVCERTGILRHPDGTRYRHPLAHLVEAADDICYGITDLEDGVELGLARFDDVADLLAKASGETASRIFASMDDLSCRQKLALLRGRIIGVLVDDVVKTFIENEHDVLSGTIFCVHDRCSPHVCEVINESKWIAKSEIFRASSKTLIEIGAYAVIDILLSALCTAAVEASNTKKSARPSFRTERILNMMGPDAPRIGESYESSIFKVVDYVCGMTDKFASRSAARLGGHIL
jgi:dGTPase